jgi:hypothetical protein
MIKIFFRQIFIEIVVFSILRLFLIYSIEEQFEMGKMRSEDFIGILYMEIIHIVISIIPYIVLYSIIKYFTKLNNSMIHLIVFPLIFTIIDIRANGFNFGVYYYIVLACCLLNSIFIYIKDAKLLDD